MITRKRQKFIDNYIRTLNGTQSAIQAGFSPKIAYSYASELLRKPEVKQAVEAGLAKLAKECKITKENVLKKLWDIANNPESKENDRIRALEVVSKIQKYHKDNEGNRIAVFQQIEKDMTADTARAVATSKRE